VLDRGFHSHDNLVELIMAKEDFTIGVPLTSQQAKECYSRLRPSLEDSRNSFLEGKRVHYGMKDVWAIEDQRLDGGRRDLPAWIFFDPDRANQQRLVIESKMMEYEAMASRRIFTSEATAQKWIAEHAKGWTEYLTVVQAPEAQPTEKPKFKNKISLQRFRVERQHEAIIAARPNLGLTLVLATIEHPSHLDAILTYRCRDLIEKMFRCDKSFLGNLRMRVHSDQVMQGRLF
jgi:transposase